MIRVLIVCEVRLYREGLALLLSVDDSMRSVAEVEDVASAIRAIARLRPDVILLDGAMPESVEHVRTIVKAEPDALLVVLGASEREPEVIGYAEAGISGYVTRDANSAVLSETIRAVARGETLCSPVVAATLLRRVAVLATSRGEASQSSRLTIREREIVDLIGQGFSNKEIAQHLYIEAATVKNHVHRILGKLEVRRRGEIAGALRGLQRL